MSALPASIDPATLLWIGAVFLLAGTVKGAIGLGLPTIALGLLAVTMDLRAAMALLLVPSFVTNIWQAFIGGHFLALLRRLWPFLLAATVAIWAGVALSRRVDAAWLAGLLGALVIAYALFGLTRPQLRLAPANESWLGPLVGIVNGVLTGLTGSFVVPGVPYLQALGLPRDVLVQAMGLLFMASTLALGAALGSGALLSADLLAISSLAILPALAGMAIGTWIRTRIAEALFRRIFFIALLLLGSYIVAGTILRL